MTRHRSLRARLGTILVLLGVTVLVVSTANLIYEEIIKSRIRRTFLRYRAHTNENIHQPEFRDNPYDDRWKLLAKEEREPNGIWQRLKQWPRYTKLPSSFHRKSMVDIRWNIENIQYVKKPACALNGNRVTFYLKTHHTLGLRRRQWVRSTWGASRKVVFVAFCGYDESECEEAEDQHEPDMMIVKGYREVEDNFSIKQALALWHAAKCDTGHIVISDDDVHWFADQIESSISAKWNNDTLIATGHMMRDQIPVRHSNPPYDKYYLNLLEYPYQLLPDFANGAGYAISKAAVQRISLHIPYTEVLRHNDDVYVGMLVYDSRVDWQNDERFDAGNYWDYPHKCNIYNIHQFCVDSEFLAMKDEQCKRKDTFNVPRGKFKSCLQK